MSGPSPPAAAFHIGWDVGGWNCDKNPTSRDALCILDVNRQIVGQPWRGNLRQSINQAADSTAWISKLFALCGARAPAESFQVTLAIDTPLGFPQALTDLITQGKPVGDIGSSGTNPYLFRYTERRLFERGIQPLSPIKDMIGSQSSKGLHALAKFAPRRQRCGVWTDGATLTAFEAYPAPCKRSVLMQSLTEPYAKLDHADKTDALTCALVAWLFAQNPAALEGPDGFVPEHEGWIWLPQDCFNSSNTRSVSS